MELPRTSTEAVPEEPAQAQSDEPAVQEEEPESVPAAGTLILKSDYNGDPLPANYTMDQLSLGSVETMTPFGLYQLRLWVSGPPPSTAPISFMAE